MSALAELLELLHDAHGRLSSFEAEYRDWSQPRPSRELVVDRSEIANGRFRGRWRGAGPWPTEIVATRRFWLQRPDRLRVEELRNHRLVRLGIRDDAQWWRWDQVEGASSGKASMTGADAGTLPPLLSPPLLDPVRLVAGLRFEPAGVGERTGRKVLRARARRRGQPSSCDRVSLELEFDAEHGTVLRRAGFEDGQCVQLTEALAVRYGPEIDPERFAFLSPDGKPAREIEAP
ncbi:MAG: hypothetical protein M3Y17_00915 [Actinomycetota bacterium]|nr:hypothetical protein [Actinomycetota bacterium]